MNVFSVFPTPEEKQSKKRRMQLNRSITIPRFEVEAIANHYFSEPIRSSLIDPSTCAIQVNELISQNHQSMKNISDFIVMCFSLIYQSNQNRPQAISLIRSCIKNDFQFEDIEMEVIIAIILRDPPIDKSLMKSSAIIIHSLCYKSPYCSSFIESKTLPGKFRESEREILQMVATLLLEKTPRHLEKSRVQLNIFKTTNVNADDKKGFDPTPTASKIHNSEIEHRIHKFFDTLQCAKPVTFITMTIVILLILFIFPLMF